MKNLEVRENIHGAHAQLALNQNKKIRALKKCREEISVQHTGGTTRVNTKEKDTSYVKGRFKEKCEATK